MHGRRLLQRCAVAARTSASGRAQVCQLPSPIHLRSSLATSLTSAQLLSTTALHVRHLSTSHPSSQSRSRRRARALGYPKEQFEPQWTPFDSAVHSASTHPSLRVLHGSFHPNSTYAVIYKPPNLSVDARPVRDSVGRRLREGWPGVAGRRRVWFPHRLDKHTEGVMVVLFDGSLNSRMGRQIAEKRWTKKYRLVGALPLGIPTERVEAGTEEAAKEEEEEQKEDETSEQTEQEQRTKLLEKRVSRLRCAHLEGELFTSRGLLPTGLLSSHLARRPLPPPSATIDFDAEERRWSTELASPDSAHQPSPPSASVHAPNSQRRIHPFVPETMLYYSVPAGGEEYSKLATTRFRLLDVDGERRQALWEAELLTGRSHQLRIHWSDAGCPVVDDPYYNHRYVWQHVVDEKARRARLASGEAEHSTPLETSAEEQPADEASDGAQPAVEGRERAVVLVSRATVDPHQSRASEAEEDEQELASDEDEAHSSAVAGQRAARASASSVNAIQRSPPPRLTPLGPSYRVLPPALSRAFSTQWQSVLDKYGVKSAEAYGSRRGGKGERRGVVDDVESVSELRESDEEESVRQMVEAKRQQKASRRRGQREVEELSVDDLQRMGEDEVELYPSTSATTSTSRPRHSAPASTPPPRRTGSAQSTRTSGPAEPIEHPLASGGWLAMSSPNIRSPFADSAHGMRLQAYYLSMPHPTQVGSVLTVVAPLPSEWTADGQAWPTAEAEWREWQAKEKSQKKAQHARERPAAPQRVKRGRL